jgi:hypothetical protein
MDGSFFCDTECFRAAWPQHKQQHKTNASARADDVGLPSCEFAAAGRWAVQKSIKGTGSIPRAQMWESVVLYDEPSSEFRLMRMA